MIVHRVCRRRYAATAFEGGGSLRYAGRWHAAGGRVVYTSATLEGAMLETLVHTPRDVPPPDMARFEADVPDDLILTAETLDPLGLHPEWRDKAPYTRAVGDGWLASARSAALSVPSAVCPGGRNVLLNPTHPDFGRIVIGEAVRLTFDPRLLHGPA